tara:strand:+ start:112 stop:297 length:186 start_codon:yes stop_codon:yes gene_type:complete
MGNRQERASKIVNLVLNSVRSRLEQIKGEDRNALENEYREWIITKNFNDDVWFSTDKSLID